MLPRLPSLECVGSSRVTRCVLLGEQSVTIKQCQLEALPGMNRTSKVTQITRPNSPVSQP